MRVRFTVEMEIGPESEMPGRAYLHDAGDMITKAAIPYGEVTYVDAVVIATRVRVA